MPMRHAVLVLVMLACSAGAQASTVFNLYTLSLPHQQVGAVMPGDSFDFLVQMLTDDDVAGVVFDVVLPMEGWTLEWHELSDYGWYENDGLWDTSVPEDPVTPVVINNNTYQTAASPPDFHISTAYYPIGTEVTGTVDIVAFRLTIPSSTIPGDYNLELANPEAADGSGTPYTGVTVGDAFLLRVLPEPGTLALSVLGVAALVAWRRRRTAV